jgi:hypothetical protein
MAMGWSAEAQAIFASNHIDGRLRAYIDVEYLGAYGLNVIEVTSRIIDWGDLERSSSAIDQNFNICEIIIRLRNDDAYLTPNFMAGSRDQIANVWRERTSGEADYKDCKFYIDLEVRLASGAWESVRLVRGKISDLNLIDDTGPACEFVVKNILMDALDKKLTMLDGDGGYYSAPTWYPNSFPWRS